MEVTQYEPRFRVVVNDEQQYALWPERKSNAPGWRDAGRSGSEQECLEYVREVWRDMRPASVRRAAT